jgi:hypothetical protein
MGTPFHAFTEAETRSRDLDRASRSPRHPTVPAPRRRHDLAQKLRRLADALDD